MHNGRAPIGGSDIVAGGGALSCKPGKTYKTLDCIIHQLQLFLL